MELWITLSQLFLCIVLFLVGYVLVRAIRINSFKKLVPVCIIALVLAMITLITELIPGYDFIIHYIPFGSWIITGVLLLALSIGLVASKPVHWRDRVLGSLLIATIFFTGYAVYYINTKTGGRIVHSEQITGNYYYDIRLNAYYPVNVPSIGYHYYGLVTRELCTPTGQSPESVPDSIKLLSSKDSLLVFNVHAGGAVYRQETDLRFSYVEEAREGIRVVWKGRKAGAINSEGQLVVPVKYEGLGTCYNGLMLATRDGKTGFINCRNEVMIPFIYRYGSNFLSDSAVVAAFNGEKFWIDKKGNCLSYYDH